MKQLVLDLTDAPAPTLGNFVPGGNGELLQQLNRLALGNAADRFIYVWGAPGSGRSHLLEAVVAAAVAAGSSGAYFACAADTRFAGNLAEMDCIAVDDVDRLGESGQGGLFSLYNRLRERDGALLVSGSVPPVDLKLRQDLVTRLGWGLVYQVHVLTDAEKLQALTQYAVLRGLRLQNEVCDFLLHRLQRDMPSLLAMLDALDRYSLETQRPVTVPLARELLDGVARRQNTGVGKG